MTNLRQLPIKEYRKRYNLGALVETGTGGGGGIEAGIAGGFVKILTCDIDPASIDYVKKEHPWPRKIEFFVGHSVELLPTMIEIVSDVNILFWLDAHYPNIRLGLSGTKVLPLMQELEMIKRARGDCAKDVIIIDDLMMMGKQAKCRRWPEDVAKYGLYEFEASDLKDHFPNHEEVTFDIGEGAVGFLPKGE